MMCGHEGWADNQIVVHHAIGIPGLDLGKVAGKTHDSFGMPMHVLCHIEFHNHFDKYIQDQPLWLMRHLEAVIRKIWVMP